MSFFNKMLASVGIGSAKVDTKLETNRIRQGDEVRGVVVIQGGSVEQDVQSIYLHVMTQYIRESNDQKIRQNAEIARIRVSEPMKIRPGENQEIPFTFQLPWQTPLSVGRTPIWIKTGLDIEMAIDPSDEDYIEVLPHPYTETILQAADQLGFRLKRAECEYSPRLGRGLPFIQELEFAPSPRFHGRLKELELVLFPSSQGIEAIVEVDRRARGLMGLFEEALDMDERKQRLVFTKEDLDRGVPSVSDQLSDLIEYHIR